LKDAAVQVVKAAEGK
ncbi:MAG: hypothetical protein ACTH5R_08160, partial [Vibrio litoralis]